MTSYVSHAAGSALWQWLRNIDPCPNRLAWCHTTDGYRLRSIIQQGEFTPKRCEVFGEDLLYFFYGRPAFRREEEEATRLSSRSPVVIVLSPNLLDIGTRLFPFDTGAFEDRYAKWLHTDMALPDFELVCTDNAPSRHVAAFFRTNSDYLRLKSTAPSVPYKGEYEVESLVALLADPEIADADDRRIAMELQISTPIKLTPTNILAFIVPDEILDASWLKDFLDGAGKGIDVEVYESSTLRRAGHYQALLEQKAREIQQKRGLT